MPFSVVRDFVAYSCCFIFCYAIVFSENATMPGLWHNEAKFCGLILICPASLVRRLMPYHPMCGMPSLLAVRFSWLWHAFGGLC